MATRAYPALLVRDLIEKATNTGVGVVFPDLPGCVTQGDTPQHAAEMAREALALHIGSMIQDGETLPEPSLQNAVPDWVDLTETEIIARLLVPLEPLA